MLDVAACLCVGAYGAAIGSFLCAVGDRRPARRSLMEPSHCVCGRRIPAWLNLPVAGWLISRGRARCCGARIPVRYLLVETLLGLWWSCAALLPGLFWPTGACALGTGLTLAVVLRRPAT